MYRPIIIETNSAGISRVRDRLTELPTEPHVITYTDIYGITLPVLVSAETHRINSHRLTHRQ